MESIKQTVEIRTLKPSIGMCIAKADKSMVFDGEVYLGKKDNEENYIEITEAEAEEIKKKIIENEQHH